MSDLEQFRDHARFMATRQHAAGCAPVRSRTGKTWTKDGYRWCGNSGAHDEHTWDDTTRFADLKVTWKCYGICTGCASKGELDLWTSLADEIDAYLASPNESEGLW